MKKKSREVDWKVLIILIVVIGFCVVVSVEYFNVFKNKIFLDEPLDFNSDSEGVIAPIPVFILKDISLAGAKALYNKNKNNPRFHIIDVSSDYNNGHIVNAVNYPIDSFETSVVGLDKTEIYLIYSRNDESRTAVKIMADNGFQNVYRLQGNYGAWVDAGFPVAH